MSRTQGAGPNLLWISLESVRADHTQPYGYGRETTPYLQRLSTRRDAVVLDPLIAASMWTPAVTASMLTGTHLSTHQVGQEGRGDRPLRSSLDTLPGLLSSAGYRTALFSTNPYIGPDTGLTRGFDHTDMAMLKRSNYFGVNSKARDSFRSVARTFLDHPTVSPGELKSELESATNRYLEYRVRRWVTRHSRGDAPLFAYIHVPSPHHPYDPPVRYRDRFLDDTKLDTRSARQLVARIYGGGSESLKRTMANGLRLSDAEWAAIEALYDGEIRYADRTVQRIVESATSVIGDDLVMVVVGDHGELFGECGLLGHNLVLHDGLIHVPGIVVGLDDETAEPGPMTQHIDLSYTIAELAGVRSDQFEGRDIRDPSRSVAISQRGTAHLDEYTKHNPAFDTSRFFESPYTAITSRDWKLLYNSEREVLFELPNERVDVSDVHPDVVAALKQQVESDSLSWEAPARDRIEYDDETTARLQDLGYSV